MNYLKLSIFTAFIFLALFASEAKAATLPVSGVVIFLKSIATKQVVSSSTDEKGNFTVPVTEESGEFNLFISDQSMTPVKVTAKKSAVTGRIVILTEDSTTVDPKPAPVKKPVPVKAPVKAVVKKAK